MQAITGAVAPNPYEPRHAESKLLYTVVAAELESFLAAARDRNHPVPAFVENTFRDFLTCGVAAHGFLRVHCDHCGEDRILAFSCKRRGLCPSCGGRRMAETAANLVDRVLPEVPMRQWVLSLPFSLRYRLAYDRTLVTPVLNAFLRAVFASLRRRARERYDIGNTKCGSVTMLQRFGGAANLNVHFHALVIDGVYVVPPHSPQVQFFALPAPSTEEVARVLEDIVQRITRALERAGLRADVDADSADPLARDDPVLAALYAAAVQGRVATGPRAGQRTTRLGDPKQAVDTPPQASVRCATLAEMSLHADVAVAADDRAGLERLARYVARPPVVTERLERLGDGRIRYRLRHRWRDGTSHLVFEPQELLARLAALIPPPRAHQTRFHGILAPCAGWRDHVVPAQEQPGDAGSNPDPCLHRPQPARAGTWIPWAWLIRRVFAADALLCPRCGSRTRIMAAIRSPDAVAAFLTCVGLPARPPPVAPARKSAYAEEPA